MSEVRITRVLDSRLAMELSVEEAERVVPFIADAISVALGYPAHPRGNMKLPKQAGHQRPRRVHEIVAASTAD
jgi:hypothetical protein